MTPAAPLKLLLVEDSPDDEALLLLELRRGGLQVEHERVQNKAGMLDALSRGGWDLVISDYSLPSFDGISAYGLLRESGSDLPFIFVSGNLGEETAVEAMRLGVSDYFVKGKLKRLVPAIQRELQKMQDRRRRREAEEALKATEQRLLQAQKMEALGRLAGGVAHDFNNLLTVIFGNAELLAEELKEQERLREPLEEITRCSQRAAALTRQLLAFGRRQPLPRQPLDLNAVVKEAAGMLRRLIGDDVELDCALAPGLDPVLADPGQLEQVLMNLAINARDAMPKGGRLGIHTAYAQLSPAEVAGTPGLKPGAYALLGVEDSGSGMGPEVLAHIFEPFFTTKEEGKGTGLGLSTVYGIIRQHEGHLAVESAPGRGSRFCVYLPFSASGLPQAQAAAPIQIPQGSGTILLAEDEAALRQLAKLMLARKGYQVLEARNPAEALALGESHPGKIHLLLTDVNMPQMDGRDLASKLRGLRPGLKVLFMSGNAPMELTEHCLPKPFNSESLARKVAEILH